MHPSPCMSVCVAFFFLVCVFVCANPFILLNLLSKTVWTKWKQKNRKSESKRMNNRTCEQDEARAIENAATLATNLIRLVSYRSFVVSSCFFFYINIFSCISLYFHLFNTLLILILWEATIRFRLFSIVECDSISLFNSFLALSWSPSIPILQ